MYLFVPPQVPSGVTFPLGTGTVEEVFVEDEAGFMEEVDEGFIEVAGVEDESLVDVAGVEDESLTDVAGVEDETFVEEETFVDDETFVLETTGGTPEAGT